MHDTELCRRLRDCNSHITRWGYAVVAADRIEEALDAAGRDVSGMGVVARVEIHLGLAGIVNGSHHDTDAAGVGTQVGVALAYLGKNRIGFDNDMS